MVGEIHPEWPRGRNIYEFVDSHSVPRSHAKGTTIQINDLERLETRATAVVLLWIFGSLAFHHITGGQMMLMESVLGGTYHGWVEMMLLSLKRQLTLCRWRTNDSCSFGIVLCSLSFEKIPTIRSQVQICDGGHRSPECATRGSY